MKKGIKAESSRKNAGHSGARALFSGYDNVAEIELSPYIEKRISLTKQTIGISDQNLVKMVSTKCFIEILIKNFDCRLCVLLHH